MRGNACMSASGPRRVHRPDSLLRPAPAGGPRRFRSRLLESSSRLGGLVLLPRLHAGALYSLPAVNLTQERLRQLLRYDPLTGRFTRLVSPSSNVRVGDEAGVVNKAGYVVIGVDGVKHYAHRLAWLYMTGKWPDAEVDHKDGVRSNNRWTNLREATDAENRMNQRAARSDNKAGVVGVRVIGPGRFGSRVKVDGKYRHLGTFSTPEAASHAYQQAKQAMHPFFAV